MESPLLADAEVATMNDWCPSSAHEQRGSTPLDGGPDDCMLVDHEAQPNSLQLDLVAPKLAWTASTAVAKAPDLGGSQGELLLPESESLRRSADDSMAATAREQEQEQKKLVLASARKQCASPMVSKQRMPICFPEELESLTPPECSSGDEDLPQVRSIA